MRHAHSIMLAGWALIAVVACGTTTTTASIAVGTYRGSVSLDAGFDPNVCGNNTNVDFQVTNPTAHGATIIAGTAPQIVAAWDGETLAWALTESGVPDGEGCSNAPNLAIKLVPGTGEISIAGTDTTTCPGAAPTTSTCGYSGKLTRTSL